MYFYHLLIFRGVLVQRFCQGIRVLNVSSKVKGMLGSAYQFYRTVVKIIIVQCFSTILRNNDDYIHFI